MSSSSYLEGTRMKSAPAVIMWAKGALNFTTPLNLGFLVPMAFTMASYLALPVPRMATWALPAASLGRAYTTETAQQQQGTCAVSIRRCVLLFAIAFCPSARYVARGAALKHSTRT